MTQNLNQPRSLSIDPVEADERFGDSVRPMAERQARRRADRESMQQRSRMRRFAAGLAVGALVAVVGVVGVRREFSHENQQARADHAALEANAVEPTTDQLQADGIVLPPSNPENQN